MLNNKPILIVIAGPNGSGKTTITSKILKHEWTEACKYLNPDEIAENELGDWNLPQNSLQAAKIATERRYSYIQNKVSFIFETVFSSNEKVEFIKKAINEGYFVRLFFVATDSPTINAARITKRMLLGGHEVPINKIISRFEKAITNCYLIANEVDRLYIYDNSVENEDAKLLFRATNGQISKTYNEINSWAIPIFDLIKK